MMIGRPYWLPRQVTCWGWLALIAILPASVIAQTDSAVSPNSPTEQSAETPPAAAKTGSDILNLDIEQLAKVPVRTPSVGFAMDTPVTTVTKQESTVGHSAAAVFVITPEMIRRSGATCIPEALRMAPGLDVAQINSSTWAISCRGFNSAYSNKLLVLIDGRSVYNTDFSGVYWNVQDVLLEDVERIEVVRGPGGTLWGSNAVNGVISIITKKAKDTQGVYASAGGGTQKQTLDGFRYGGKIGEDVNYRVYGKHFEQGPGFDPTGQVDDAWRQGRFGFRADWEPDRDGADLLTIQGDHYVGNSGTGIIPTDPGLPEQQTGENLLVRWRHVYDEQRDWSLQMYYDNASRFCTLQTEVVKTFDIDYQYRFPVNDRHSLTCGTGYRNVESYFPGGDQFTNWYPYPYFTTNYTNQFIQDEITLVDDLLTFTLGIKLEQNPYTGLEYQPSARMLWTPDAKRSGWAAISRAVRTPSRYQEQATITLPPLFDSVYPRVFGQPDARSEAVIAYEVGFREQATEDLSWDIATFYNAYDNLVCTVTPIQQMDVFIPMILTNGPRGETYGVELASNYTVSERWRLYGQYTLFQMHLYPDPTQEIEGGNDPCNQVYVRSAWDLREDLEFDLMARYVDRLVTLEVPSYITMDLRMAWRPRKHIELAVVGQNLLQAYHYEFAGGTVKSPTYATEVPRGVYGTLTWRR